MFGEAYPRAISHAPVRVRVRWSGHDLLFELRGGILIMQYPGPWKIRVPQAERSRISGTIIPQQDKWALPGIRPLRVSTVEPVHSVRVYSCPVY